MTSILGKNVWRVVIQNNKLTRIWGIFNPKMEKKHNMLEGAKPYADKTKKKIYFSMDAWVNKYGLKIPVHY